MKKGRRYITRFLPMLLISLILGGTLWSWNARKLGGDAIPMPFGVGMSVILSGSMEPTLSVNDLVFIRAADRYEPGDVVVYQSDGMAVIHRLIETDGVTAITKGDANNAADGPIPAYSIKGKLVGRIPRVGTAIRILKTPVGTLVLLAAAVYLLLRSHRKEEADADDELDRIRQEIEQLKADMLSAEEKENSRTAEPGEKGSE